MKILNDILEPKEMPLVITGLHNEIKLTCQYPKHSVLLCYIDGYSPLTYFPLVWTGEVKDDGLVFSGKLLLNKHMLEFVKNNLDNSYLCFKIFSTTIQGKQKFTINYASIDRVISSLPNTYLQLVNTVNEISVKLDEYINKTFTQTPIITDAEHTVIKGMVPVAIDSAGNYVWDFPFMKEKQIVLESLNVLKDISNQISQLTNRVNNLEHKLLSHIYVEYE